MNKHLKKALLGAAKSALNELIKLIEDVEKTLDSVSAKSNVEKKSSNKKG